MALASDTPTSQVATTGWSFYRRLGLLLRTCFNSDGTTVSLHELSARTGGRISADQLIALLAQRAQARPDAVTLVLLAQAFEVDPEFFVTDEAVAEYVAGIRAQYSARGSAGFEQVTGLQWQAYTVAAHASQDAVVAVRY